MEILRGTTAAAIGRMLKVAAIPDAETVIHGQDDESAAREILIRRVRVGVIVRVMPAEQHLSRRAAMHEDDGWLAASTCERRIVSLEELTVDLEAVGRVEYDPARHDELRRRKIGRNAVEDDPSDGAPGLRRHDRATSAAGRCRADERDRRTVTGEHRRPLE